MLTRQEAQVLNVVVIGFVIVDHLQAQVLFDSRATHSFIFKKFAILLNKSCKLFESTLTILLIMAS